ncbi:MAG: bifunctional diguanylate cyclase/phosphodiesterase [Eubacteriales bacterium]
MDYKQFFEIQTNDCTNATFFMDYDTEELIYLNTAMEKKFQIFEDYTNKKASSVIPYFSDVCGYRNKSDLQMGEFFDMTFLSETLNCNLRSKATKIELQERNFIQVKYFLAPISDRRQEAETVFEKSMALCLEILSDVKNPSPIHSFLELLGEFYACNLTYVIEFDVKNGTVAHLYLWTKDKGLENMVTTIPENIDQNGMSRFAKWLESDHHRSIVNIDKNEQFYEKNSVETMILNQYDISNITLGKLWNKDGSLMGVIGLSNRAELMYDDRLLQAISHFVMEHFSKKSMVDALEDLNDVDLLTGFYNRTKYLAKMKELEENPPETLGVLFVNLNGLRNTNEHLGYEAGDEQLRKTASLLNEYFISHFYRVTGDEFVGFVADCQQDILEETVASVQERLKHQQNEATFSLGHSWGQGNYDLQDLIKIADTIMVINKQSFYNDTLKDLGKIQNTMLKDLLRGIENEEFLVYLQAQVDLKTEKVVSAEALIRRQRPDKMIYPDQFIGLYEENNLIRHVDLYVVRKVCLLLKSWMEKGKEMPISVNLSRVTLLEYDIVNVITAILDEYEIPHHLIIIEITERIGVTENDVASTLVENFKSQGYQISLDDFGCAYSNIVTLAKISFNEVKIDKSLVDDVLINENNKVIVESLLGMCHKLPNTHTLAEGIETKEQAEFLRLADCDLGQGYFYAKPMSQEDFTEKYI